MTIAGAFAKALSLGDAVQMDQSGAKRSVYQRCLAKNKIGHEGPKLDVFATAVPDR